MMSYIIRRVLLIIPTVFLAAPFLFFLFFLLPGDPATLIVAGSNSSGRRGRRRARRERYGLDDPIYEQYFDYWNRTVRWDLGESSENGRPVSEILSDASVGGIRLAILGRHHRGDRRHLGGGGVGDPKILVAGQADDGHHRGGVRNTGLRARLSPHLGVRRVPGPARVGTRLGADEDFRHRSQHVGAVLHTRSATSGATCSSPRSTLACVSTALCAGITRGSMLEVLGADYMRTVRGRLARTFRRIAAWVRNAMLPVITLIGLDFGTVIGSAVLTETVFSWPGIGSLIADSVTDRDIAVLLGLTLVVVLAFAVINLIVDLSYAWSIHVSASVGMCNERTSRTGYPREQ